MRSDALVALGLVGVAAVASARDAHACGVIWGSSNTGSIRATPADVATPLLELSGGTSTEGPRGSIALGYGWGDRHRDQREGSSIMRVLSHAEYSREALSFALTYGWYQNQIAATGIDVGLSARFEDGERGYGPTARFTLGTHVVAARLAIGATFGDADAVTAGLDLVVNVSELTGAI